MPQLEVLIDEDGNVSIEAIGFKGKACDLATADLEKALGKVKTKNRKKEFYNVEGQRNKEVNRIHMK